ncbi:gliding motility-associated C-terminal domain-containing protein [Flavobacterium ardleyense]|uniref:Gliding motility-associated C-terminal domain-containing protein n=1 Tax=Flavobacterium ardleyense TaxID=2038737 RepID=A0ABW5Z4H8_9FLAO
MNLKNYIFKNMAEQTTLLYVLLFLSFSYFGVAQVRVGFTPRKPAANPSQTIYNVKGDFTLIGNTNLTLNSYGVNTQNGNNKMNYVDVDSDNTTFNSSSANLTFSTENGAIPSCSKVVFAGLYWTGRASNSSPSSDTFTVTKNGTTKTLNKRKVRLKGPTAGSYTEVTAGTNDIYYPQNSDDYMYSAFAEITDYVQTNGVGKYTVADIALVEGNGGGTGYYGGWGIIVVYENSKMKWRDITIFDGHAFVAASTVSHQIPISGFNAVQSGQVNVKLGLMAGEGDRGITGDYFDIRRVNNSWLGLDHAGNSVDNFFNSSIQTGGNTRSPNLVNNTGLDISMFNIPNPNNSVIANNQTSTALRYGSTGDTYVVFMAAMAVDAYIPEIQGIMSLETIDGLPATGITSVTPGQELEYSIKIVNQGTEAVNNTKIKIDIPYMATYVNGSAVKTINFSPLPSPNTVSFNPSIGPSGLLTWDVGTLPIPANPSTILGELRYKIKVTEDCFLLTNQICTPSATLQGFINGTGSITGVSISNQPFIQGYETSGTCVGEPITRPLKIDVNAINFVNQNCQNESTNTSFNFCGSASGIPFSTIVATYPNGTLFYDSYPVTASSVQYTSANPFPSNVVGSTTYYAVPADPNGCYFKFVISIDDVPTITGPSSATFNGCGTNGIAPLAFSTAPVTITLQDFITAGGTVSNSLLNYTITYKDVATGSCPTIVTRKFTISTTCISVNFNQTITINDIIAPVFNEIAPAHVTVECNAVPAAATLTATDNCDSNIVVTFIEVKNSSEGGSCSNNYKLVRTWTATDLCGNTTSVSQTITVQDRQAPTFTSTAPADVTVECNAVPTAATLLATDNCSDAIVTFNEVKTDGSCANNYKLVRTWTATDVCGNTTSVSQSITVQDTQAPTFTSTAPADVTVECNAVPTAITLLATDTCDANVVVTFNEVKTDGSCANNYQLVRTWTATDLCGNTTSVSQTINVQHTQAPTFTSTAPANVTVECNAVPTASTLLATDTCDANVVVTFNEVKTDGSCANNYQLVRTWTATDLCGNATSVSQTINVQDTQAPTFTSTAPANVTVECNAVPTAITLLATDTCDANVVVTFNEVKTDGSCANNYKLVRTWTATDLCGNTTSVSQTINVQDTQAPTFTSTAPANVTVECNAVPTAITLLATDTCDANVVVTFNEVKTDGSCANNYQLVRTWTATDLCGNTNSVSQTITVQDTQAPTFTSTAPANVTVECNAVPTAITLLATDTCDANVVVTFNEVKTDGSCANNYQLVRTWTATDVCGNTTSVSQTITVQDTQAPTFTSTAPANVTVECNAVPTAITLLATDTCDANVVVTFNEVKTDGSCANNYQLVRTWTATDVCGNTTSVSQTINVQDTQAPIFTSTAPANVTVECNAVPTVTTLLATDNCSDAIVTFNEVKTDGSCANNYKLVRTWTATDLCGNTTSVSQTITVQDTQAPIFTTTAPADVTVECNAVPTAITLLATDTCDANVVVAFNEVKTDGSCANNYKLVRTWTATDVCGNTTSVSQTITVQDTQAPTFTSTAPADVTVECNAVPTAITLLATDTCDSNVVVTFNEVKTDGSCANNYQLVRTWKATDACGNTTSVSQTITVQDTQAPIFTTTAPADVTVECNSVPTAITLLATDTCDANVVVTFNEVKTDGSCANNYQLARTWTATDLCGNTTSVSQTITVQDTQAPTFTSTAPADVTVECNAVPTAIKLLATDTCDANVVVTFNEVKTDGSCANNYQLVRTWTATDVCGNTTSVSQTITVQDTQAPIFTTTAPADVTVECNAVPVAVTLLATDTCDANVVVTFNEVKTDGSCANNYQLVRTWTATDVCGNTTSVSQTRTVQDTQAPTFTSTAPADVTVECNAVPTAIKLLATDTCDANVVVTFNEVKTDGSCANNYKLVRTWTATDACGNTTSVSQTINVQDTQAPIFTSTAPADLTVECNAVPTAITLLATDTCDANAVVTFNEVKTDGSCVNNYQLVRTWTATDACGNKTSVSQTITVQDTQTPIFTTTVPANVTVECNAVPTAITLLATDTCDANAVVTFNEVKIDGSCTNNYQLVRTWTATDVCGNTTSVSQTINVQDTQAPTFTSTAPADVTVECNAVPAVITLLATDTCDANVVVTFNEVKTDGSCANNYKLVRTWTATDVCGNTTSVSQTITVQDTQAPIFTTTVPANVTVECNAVPTAITLLATDTCDANVVVTFNEVKTDGSCANNYQLVRTWTATDVCGNTTSVSQTITIQDTQAPTFTSTAPADVTVECKAVPTVATLLATDNCSDAIVTFNEVKTDGSCANNYQLVRTWTATDLCGNRTSVSQTINVQDTQAPTFTSTAPADVTVECNAVPTAVTLLATDTCDANVVVTFNEVKTDGSCANNYQLVRTWTATDVCGNTTSVLQTINVQDTQAPTFTSTAPADVTVECNAVPTAVTLLATDTCDANVVVTFNEVKTDGSCANNYQLVRTWTATDVCGNTTSISQTINVQDTQAPTFTTTAPADVTVECNAVPTAITLLATDTCDANVVVSFNEVKTDGSCANNYQLVRTWTATDVCGNTTSVSQTISVQDTQAPIFTSTAPTDLTVECNAVPTAVTLLATDTCDANVVVTFNEVKTDGSCANSYQLVRTWTATDLCGNTTSVSQTITVQDTQAPTFTSTAPADVTVECKAVPTVASLLATDNCSDAIVTFNEVKTDGSCANNYQLVRTWTATDVCGNTTSVSQTINVQDTQAPTFTSTAPADVTVECNAVPTAITLLAIDTCDANVVVTFNEVKTDGSCANNYQLVRTWTATDVCGNTTSVSQTINAQDTKAPTFTSTAPADVTVECNSVPTAITLLATDTCDANVVVTFNEVKTNGSCANNYQLVRTWTATDVCGNTTSISQTINVQDTQAPTFTTTAPADVTVECNSVPTAVTLLATDTCDANVVVSFNEVKTDGSCANNYQLVRTWTATDVCGNTTSVSQTISVQDTQAPIFTSTAPADVTVECNAVPTAITLLAIDTCDATVVVTFNEVKTDGSCANNYKLVRTWTATDVCGNTTSISQTINVQDTQAPIITVQAADALVECDGQGNTEALNAWLASNAGAIANDICSSVTWSNNFNTVTDTCGATGTAAVTFTATDDCGNTSTSDATFTIIDTTAPVFSSDLPANVSVSCDNLPTVQTVTAIDNCDTNVLVTLVETLDYEGSNCAGSYNIIRTWTATDACNNNVSHTQVITVSDTTPPTILTPLEAVIDVICSEIPPVPTPEFTDNCSGILDVVYTETVTTISIYDYTITHQWLVSDNCGNEATFSQVLNVIIDKPFDSINYAICTEDEALDLFSVIGASVPTNGVWTETTSSGGLTGSIFNPLNVSLGYYTFQYVVTQENNDCPMIFEIYLNVNDDCVVLAACDITVYNAVSPNDDGSNDLFFIDGLECYPKNNVEIYNRWGVLVYDQSGYDNLTKSFKGKSEGRSTFNKNELLPDGTYFYILKYTDAENNNHNKSGYLYLNR